MNRLLLVLVLGATATLVGCGGGDSLQDTADSGVPPCCKALPGSDDIGHSTVFNGSTSIAETRYVVIRDAVAWQAFWSEHNNGVSPASPLPPIDFSTSMVVGVVAAQLPSDCYFVYARRVSWAPSASTADHIEVTFHVQPPGTGCVVHELSVSRMFLEAMPRSELQVVFLPVD
jgi:hypothetical protein